MNRDNDNIIIYLWQKATSENSLLSMWGWVAVFLLGCAYFGGYSFWSGLQGKNCGSSFGSGSEIPFTAACRGGGFVRSVFEVIFPESAPAPASRPSIVRPPNQP